MLVAIALCNRGGKEEWHHFQWEAWKGRSCQERRTTINKANEMAVESGERWNGWLGLTHYLIYPQRPCEHSGVIHYFTSSITPRGQAKRPSPHPQLPPKGPGSEGSLRGGEEVVENSLTHTHRSRRGCRWFRGLCIPQSAHSSVS